MLLFFVRMFLKKNVQRKNERSCGIDLGITNFVTINTGEIIRFPEQNKITHLDKKKEKIALEALSRKQSQSNNRQKTKEKLSGVYIKIHNTLKYHFYKIAQRLTEKYHGNMSRNTEHQGYVKK